MTLYNLLVDKMADSVHDSVKLFGDNDEFYKAIGKANMCDELLKLLSDDTLKMEVTTRVEAIAKGESK